MINQYKLVKAFTNKAKEISIATGYDFAVQGEKFEPSPSQTYIAEKTVPTQVTGKVGSGSDVERGFYQLTICTPLGKGKYSNLKLMDDVRAFFPNGVQAGIEFDGQLVSISTVSPSGMYKDDTHLKTALTINYTVIA